MVSHGYSAYTHGCRCDECRDAKADYMYRLRRSRELPADDPRHGTRNGFQNFFCRCLPCQQANARYYRAYLDAGGAR